MFCHGHGHLRDRLFARRARRRQDTLQQLHSEQNDGGKVAANAHAVDSNGGFREQGGGYGGVSAIGSVIR
jgi:hypothetical protein